MSERSASYIKSVFFIAVTVLSMATSFLYFLTVFQFGTSLLAAGLTGAVGVLVTDVAAIAWLYTYLKASDNNDERALAMFGIVAGVMGSVTASFVYLLSTTTYVTLPPQMATWSTIAMAVLVVVHFLLVIASSYRATSAQVAERTSALMSEATEETLRLTEQSFRSAIPSLAARNAERLTRNLAATFAMASEYSSEYSPVKVIDAPRQEQVSGGAAVAAPARFHSAGAGGSAYVLTTTDTSISVDADEAVAIAKRFVDGKIDIAQFDAEIAALHARSAGVGG